MRVLIAPDKFKGTLTAQQAAGAIAEGWRQARPDDEPTLLPMSDGGDGFGAVLSELIGARTRGIRTVDAAHRTITADWGWDAKTRTAVIESAKIIGLAMLPPKKFHPFQLDTTGLAQALKAARRAGAHRIIVGIGGSATNDGGFGLARALGWKFRDGGGKEILHWTQLHRLKHIESPQTAWPRGLIEVAVDVQNPLLGSRGATRVYGPQKGLRPPDFKPAEACLRKLAHLARIELGKDFATTPGAGAAGGLGFGLATFANARFTSGFELFARQSKLRRTLRHVDLLITGEGASDRSTLMGKGAGQIAQLGRQRKLPVLGLVGTLSDTKLLRSAFTVAMALTDLTNPADARKRAAFWLRRLACRAGNRVTHQDSKVGWQAP